MNKQEYANENYKKYMQSEQWKRISATRRQIDDNACVMCGCRGTANNPLQCHHLGYTKPLGTENVFRDLVTLCHCCHKLVHRLMNRKADAQGRPGWGNPSIPKVSAFISGGVVEYKEVTD